MSGVAIPYRSDAQCVRVNKLVVCLCLSVFLLISHPPSLPLNIQNIVYLSSSLTGRPSPSRSPSLSLSSTISLITVSLHPSSSILYSTNPFHPASRNSVRSWVFAHSTRRVKLLCKATWFCPSVIPVMFHCQLTQTMQSFTAVDILSLTCGLRQWYVLGPAQERTHWQRMISNICRVAPESCYKQMT